MNEEAGKLTLVEAVDIALEGTLDSCLDAIGVPPVPEPTSVAPAEMWDRRNALDLSTFDAAARRRYREEFFKR